jgi:glucose-6-phosphate-specific signal transduction histidine kinase
MTLWISDPRFGIKLYPMVVAVRITLFWIFYVDDYHDQRYWRRVNITINTLKHMCVLRDQICLN